MGLKRRILAALSVLILIGLMLPVVSFPASVDAQAYFDPDLRAIRFGSDSSTMVYANGVIYGIPRGGSYHTWVAYNVATNSWSTLTSVPVTHVSATRPVWDGGDYIYLSTVMADQRWYRYSIANDTWTRLEDTPAACTAGHAATYDGSNLIYVLRGSSTDFWAYSISADSWTALTGGAYGGGGSFLVHTGGDYIYAADGGASTNFRRYTISTDTWASMTATPGTNGSGSAFWDGSNTIYYMRGATNTDISEYSISGNSWSKTTDTPARRYENGHMAWDGGDNIYMTQGQLFWGFWLYDKTADEWNPEPTITAVTPPSDPSSPYPEWAPTPETIAQPVTFSSGNDGRYYYATIAGTSRNFWRYGAHTNTWQALTPLVGDEVAASVEYDGYIYVLRANRTAFRRYVVATGAWETLEPCLSIPMTLEGIAVGSLISTNDGNLYATVEPYGAALSSGYPSESRAVILKYDTALDSWSLVSQAPAGYLRGVGMVWDGSDRLYMVRGHTSGLFYYDMTLDSWHAAAHPPTNYRSGATAFYDGHVYLLRGRGTSLLWRYDPTGDSWEYVSYAPEILATPINSMVSDGANRLYVLGEEGTTEFWEANLTMTALSMWQVLGPEPAPRTTPYHLPTTISVGGSLSWTSDAYLYAVGGGYGDLMRYSIAHDYWEPRASYPVAISGTSAQLAYDGDNYIYLHVANDFHRYNISGNVWESLTACTGGTNWGGTVWAGGDNLYMVPHDGRNEFLHYNTATDTWTNLGTMMHGEDSVDARLVWTEGDFIYCRPRFNQHYFTRYEISTDTWVRLTDAPFTLRSGSSLTWDGANYIYATHGGQQQGFARYSISGNTWTNLPNTPGTMYSGGYGQWALVVGGDYCYVQSGDSRSDFWVFKMSTQEWNPYVPTLLTPTVTTDEATNVAGESATIHGTLSSIGDHGSVDVYFEYWEDGASVYSTNRETRTSTGSFTHGFTGLSVSTTYHYRACADYNGETVYGSTRSFVTPAHTLPGDFGDAVVRFSFPLVAAAGVLLAGFVRSRGNPFIMLVAVALAITAFILIKAFVGAFL